MMLDLERFGCWVPVVEFSNVLVVSTIEKISLSDFLFRIEEVFHEWYKIHGDDEQECAGWRKDKLIDNLKPVYNELGFPDDTIKRANNKTQLC